MAVINGKDCKLYYLPSGTREAWPATLDPDNIVEITNVKDIEMATPVSASVDSTTRASGDFDTEEPIGIKLSITGEMPWDTTDTAFAAFLDAYQGNPVIPVACLDGDSTTAGTEGVWADMKLHNFNRSEPLRGEAVASFELRPCRSSVPAEWVLVATS